MVKQPPCQYIHSAVCINVLPLCLLQFSCCLQHLCDTCAQPFLSLQLMHQLGSRSCRPLEATCCLIPCLAAASLNHYDQCMFLCMQGLQAAYKGTRVGLRRLRLVWSQRARLFKRGKHPFASVQHHVSLCYWVEEV